MDNRHPSRSGFQHRLILIAVSTGGPVALKQLFTGMPRLDASIVVVQHMPKYINQRVTQKLGTLTDMDVVLAEHNSQLQHGVVYIAPSEIHLELIGNRRIQLKEGPKVCYVCPAADVMMKSVRQKDKHWLAAVVLTGMGVDGTQGLRHIKQIGGATFAQNEESCAIFGMPKSAIATGAVDTIGTPEIIQRKLTTLTGTQSRSTQR